MVTLSGRAIFHERFKEYTQTTASTLAISRKCNIPRQTVRTWERGTGSPTCSTLKKLVDGTGISADWWIGASDRKELS